MGHFDWCNSNIFDTPPNRRCYHQCFIVKVLHFNPPMYKSTILNKGYGTNCDANGKVLGAHSWGASWVHVAHLNV